MQLFYYQWDMKIQIIDSDYIHICHRFALSHPPPINSMIELRYCMLNFFYFLKFTVGYKKKQNNKNNQNNNSKNTFFSLRPCPPF